MFLTSYPLVFHCDVSAI